jgi:hypothetical protein
MSSYLVAVYPLIDAHENPRAEVAGVLQGVLTSVDSALIRWAIAGDDISSSIAQVTLPDNYAPDETAFPLWPGRMF